MLFWCVAIKIVWIVCFEEVVPGLHDGSNNQLKRADIPGVRLPFKYNLREIHISRPLSEDFLSVPYILSSSSVTGELAI